MEVHQPDVTESDVAVNTNTLTKLKWQDYSLSTHVKEIAGKKCLDFYDIWQML